MKTVILKSALLGTIAFASISASADTISFAQFVQISSVRGFGYVNQDTIKKGVITPQAEITSLVNTGTTKRPKLAMGSPTVNVTALVDGVAGSGITAGEIIASHLTIDASSTSAVDSTAAPFSQLFSGSLKLVDIATGQVLLNGIFTNGAFAATVGANSATFDANTTSGTLVYTSDVFALGATNDLALSITGLSNKISSLKGHSFNYSTGTQGSLTGTFSTAIPEPATVAMFILGLGALGLRMRRRNAT